MTRQYFEPGDATSRPRKLGSCLLLGMVLSGAGCADTRSTDVAVTAQDASSQPNTSRVLDAGQSAPAQTAADSGVLSSASSAGSVASTPAPAQDAGTPCRSGGALIDYCANEPCPQKFNGVVSLCRGRDEPHEYAKNSCSGKSALLHGADGDTRYDYGEENQLIGVTVLGGKRTCDGSAVTYGDACSITGTLEPFCGRGCGFIGCAPTVTIWMDVTTPKDYQKASVKFCRNDLCSSGSANETIEAASANKEIIFSGQLNDTSSIVFLLDTTGSAPTMLIQFSGLDKDLQDGDHYLISVTSPDGRELYKFDQTIERYDFGEVLEFCTLLCKGKAFDSRTKQPDSSDSDAGTP